MLKETADVGSMGQKITVMVGAEERSSLSVQSACSELRWKTECQLGSVVLGANLLGTRCQSGSTCGLAVLWFLSSSYSS